MVADYKFTLYVQRGKDYAAMVYVIGTTFKMGNLDSDGKSHCTIYDRNSSYSNLSYIYNFRHPHYAERHAIKQGHWHREHAVVDDVFSMR